MDDCIFCKIVQKQIPADFLYEGEEVVAFKDINPSADIHILIVPKVHVGAFTDLMGDPPAGRAGYGNLLVEVYKVAGKLVKNLNLEGRAYRVVVNGGKAQKVPHLHFHLLGGKWFKKV